jgi:hypothetical protein
MLYDVLGIARALSTLCSSLVSAGLERLSARPAQLVDRCPGLLVPERGGEGRGERMKAVLQGLHEQLGIKVGGKGGVRRGA